MLHSGVQICEFHFSYTESSPVSNTFVFSGEGEEPMTALDAERLAQGVKSKLT